MSWLTVRAAAEATGTPLDGVRWLIGAGFLAAFTDTDGVTWVDPDDVRRQRAGLNDAPVAETLRNVADPWERAGVALRVMQALQGEIADLNDVLVGAVAELLDHGHEVVEIAERLACEPDVLPVPGPATPGPAAGEVDRAHGGDAKDVGVGDHAESAPDTGESDAGVPDGDAGAPGIEPSEIDQGHADGSAPGDPQVEVEGEPGVEGRAAGPETGPGTPAPSADHAGADGTGAEPLSADRTGAVDPGADALSAHQTDADHTGTDRTGAVRPDADLTAPVRLVESGGEDQHSSPPAPAPPTPEAQARSIVVDDGAAEPAEDLEEEVGAAVLEFRRAAGDDQPAVVWALPTPTAPADEGARPGPASVDAPEEDQPMATPTPDDEGPGIGWGPIDVTAIVRTVSSDVEAVAREVGAVARTVTSAVGRVLSALRRR